MIVALLVACRPRAKPPENPQDVPGAPEASAALSADTLRGTLVELGSAPNTVLVLRPSKGEPVALAGTSMPLLRRVVGLEIVVEGRRTGGRAVATTPGGSPVFAVDRFIVRAADGTPAHDGVVTSVAGTLSLTLSNGRRVVVSAMPGALASKIGARVFLAGPLHLAPVAYGIIAEAR